MFESQPLEAGNDLFAIVSAQGSDTVTDFVSGADRLRVSMSAAYGASFGDAQTALQAILQLKSHRFLTDAVPSTVGLDYAKNFMIDGSLQGAETLAETDKLGK